MSRPSGMSAKPWVWEDNFLTPSRRHEAVSLHWRSPSAKQSSQADRTVHLQGCGPSPLVTPLSTLFPRPSLFETEHSLPVFFHIHHRPVAPSRLCERSL